MTDYWIVDPDRGTIRVHRRGGAGFDHPTELSIDAGDVLATPLLPGLRMRLADVFRQ